MRGLWMYFQAALTRTLRDVDFPVFVIEPDRIVLPDER